MINLKSLWYAKKSESPLYKDFYKDFFQEATYEKVSEKKNEEFQSDARKAEDMEAWLLTIFSKKMNCPVKKVKVRKPLRVGRERSNDVVVNGREQHRFVLEIGMDEKGIFVNSLNHEDGEYAYGNGSYNHLSPKTSLIPKKEIPLKIVYGHLIYIIENTNYKCSSAEKGKVVRNESEITE